MACNSGDHVLKSHGIDLRSALADCWDVTLSILVCGKTGVGKSSLVNLLVGKEVCDVGGPGSITNDPSKIFTPVTDRVEASTVNIEGVQLCIFDSPGLQDGTANERWYLEEMYKNCRDVDLVLYCIDMTIARWTKAEIEATSKLSRRFGNGFWQKTVVVLTKANMYRSRLESQDEKRTFERAYHAFVNQFRSQLKRQSVPPGIADGIPAVAAGSDADRELPYVSEEAAKSTPPHVYPDFLPELWITCLERVSKKARGYFVQATAPQRFKLRKERASEEMFQLVESLQRMIDFQERKMREDRASFEKKMDEMREKSSETIYLNEGHLQRLTKVYKDTENKSLAATIGGGAALGAGVGATVGLVGGPAGVAIGGLIGTAVGGGAAAILATLGRRLIKDYKER